jgi:hypothetical protein
MPGQKIQDFPFRSNFTRTECYTADPGLATGSAFTVPAASNFAGNATKTAIKNSVTSGENTNSDATSENIALISKKPKHPSVSGLRIRPESLPDTLIANLN